MNKFVLYITILLTSALSLQSLAQVTNGSGTTSSGGTSASNSGGQTIYGAQQEQDKHNNAKAEKKAAKGGSGTNAMVSGMMFAAGAACMAACSGKPCMPACPPLMMMGALAGSQAGHDGDSAYGAHLSSLDSGMCVTAECLSGKIDKANLPDGEGIFALDPSEPVDFGPLKTVGEIQQAMVEYKENMDKYGIAIDPETGNVTMGDQTMTPAQLNAMAASGEGLNALGKDAVAKANELGKKAAEEMEAYKVSSMGLAGGGGGGSNYKFKPYESDFDMSKYLNGLKGKKRGPASVAGMKRMVNGEPIGVAGDDIFAMIHRRYQTKRKANIFIEKATASPVKGQNQF